MKELQELLAEAEHFKERRSGLALNLKRVDEHYKKDIESLSWRQRLRAMNQRENPHFLQLSLRLRMKLLTTLE